MKHLIAPTPFVLFSLITIASLCYVVIPSWNRSMAQKSQSSTEPTSPTADEEPLPDVPVSLPEWKATDIPKINGLETNLSPWLQERLTRFVQYRGNPIAAVMLVSVRTGEVLAMVQGRHPREWNGATHTALHVGFPAASLFKTVVSTAAIEIANIDPNYATGLVGGCAKVNARGGWMRFDVKDHRHKMSLRRAYGTSCNGYFAKLAVNEIGFGPIISLARRFGWNGHQINADFKIPPSPLREPDPRSSSVHTIGEFAAGFGYVGVSAAHSAWQALAIANGGVPKPLRLFVNSEKLVYDSNIEQPIMNPETAQQLLDIMDSTVLGGTASSAFRRGKYGKIRFEVGGKTGTLTGDFPPGLTTWFTGVYPLKNPEVVVAAVTVLEELWQFKAANLAAEALISYQEWQQQRTSLVNSQDSSPLKN